MTYRKPSSEILYRLADNVKRLRQARGLTQAQLGRLTAFHKNYISDVERATINITLGNLEALAVGLKCSEADLLWRYC
jgi:transcriptional regulator with XRE-family HTH domain